MKDIFDLLISLLEALGVTGESKNQIVLILVCTSLLILFLYTLFFVVFPFIYKKYRILILNKDLSPYFVKSEVFIKIKYFIPTTFQLYSPNEGDEPESENKNKKNQLMPVIIKKTIKDRFNDNKFILILGDSGMGKTTFLINLYVKYKNNLSHILFGLNYDMYLFPLGDESTLDKVSKIENKKNAVLLLDAFDEDVKSLNNYKFRIEELCRLTKDFKVTIMTCRTQFFPIESEEPKSTGIMTFGDHGEYIFDRYYLSVFSKSDIDSYLKKRYNILNKEKRVKARDLIMQAPSLMVRPILLNYINDLIDSSIQSNYSFDIYRILIDKWISRESKKVGIVKKYGSAEAYSKVLYDFSVKLAANMYLNRLVRNGIYINYNEKFELKGSLSIKDYDIDYSSINDDEVRSKSLLSRNAAGQYKFSHKSIFEYFMAVYLFENYKMAREINYTGFDLMEKFHNELIINDLKNYNGTFRTRLKRENLVAMRLDDIKCVDTLSIVISKTIPQVFFYRFPKLRTFNIFTNKILKSYLTIMSVWISYQEKILISYLAELMSNVDKHSEEFVFLESIQKYFLISFSFSPLNKEFLIEEFFANSSSYYTPELSVEIYLEVLNLAPLVLAPSSSKNGQETYNITSLKMKLIKMQTDYISNIYLARGHKHSQSSLIFSALGYFFNERYLLEARKFENFREVKVEYLDKYKDLIIDVLFLHVTSSMPKANVRVLLYKEYFSGGKYFDLIKTDIKDSIDIINQINYLHKTGDSNNVSIEVYS